MSEHGHEPVEQRSKIKLTRNAKGEPQWEISVITGTTTQELDEARKLAVAQWTALETELPT